MSELRARPLVVAVMLALAPAVRGRDARPPADMKPYTETVPGTSVTFDMVPLAGGTFRMGSPASEAGRAEDEGPAHEVTLRPFWIGKFEVTWSEYDRFWLDTAVAQASYASEIKAAGVDALTRPTPPYADESFGFGKGKQPVISVGHHAAMEYARWLSRKTGKVYRLPTEAEWEYACRAGTATAYSFGDDPAALGEHGWSAGNSTGQPRPVGGKKPNPWGLFDMHGNAGEWVLDLYQKDAYQTRATTPALAPVFMPTERIYPHVVRGGSWDHDAPALRCAARLASQVEWNRRDPQRPQSIWWLTDATFVGFRLVRPLEEQKELIELRSRVTKESP
jgi:formylglycine-generating enzyme required for sulfatase activity